jgi:uncharacterized protein
MMAKKWEIDSRIILAVCDKEHLGKTFEEGELCFKASEKFYGGEEITPQELEKLLFQVDSANLFGNKCVEIALKKELISEKSIITICGIKHAQIYRM